MMKLSYVVAWRSWYVLLIPNDREYAESRWGPRTNRTKDQAKEDHLKTMTYVADWVNHEEKVGEKSVYMQAGACRMISKSVKRVIEVCKDIPDVISTYMSLRQFYLHDY